jgi:hypothetical protein
MAQVGFAKDDDVGPGTLLSTDDHAGAAAFQRCRCLSSHCSHRASSQDDKQRQPKTGAA